MLRFIFIDKKQVLDIFLIYVLTTYLAFNWLLVIIRKKMQRPIIKKKLIKNTPKQNLL